ncbi:MAG: diphthine--ammonia ligase [Rhizomicrobium sp.]
MTTPVSERRRALLSWSGGKDSCLALHEVLQSREADIEALLTTMTQDYDRISMHGVRRTLLERQAASLGLPVSEVAIPKDADNAIYESRMGEALATQRERGVEAIVFGDLFLADVRAWREQLIARHGLTGIFPLWGRDTHAVIRDFLDRGFRAVVVCVDPAKLDPSFAGRVIDEGFLADLPASVDPCGENGEFHTFVFGGPIFKQPVKYSRGEIVHRSAFWFCDLVPENKDGVQEPC